MNELSLIFDYLTRRKQRVKINLSICLDLFQSVPQGPILRLSGSYLLRKLITLRICVLEVLTSPHLQKKKKNTFSINIDNEGIKNSNDKKLLGVHLNNKPGFGL